MNHTPIKCSRIWIKSCFPYSSFFLSCYLSSLSPSASLALSEFSSGFHHSWDKHALFCSTCHSATPPSTASHLKMNISPFIFPALLHCYLSGKLVCLLFYLLMALSDPHHLHPYFLYSPETLSFFISRPRRTAVGFFLHLGCRNC